MATLLAMDDPTTWPLDLLPLARPTGGLWPELGLLLPGKGPVVYLTGAFEPGLDARLKACGRETYLTFRDLADAGWRVD